MDGLGSICWQKTGGATTVKRLLSVFDYSGIWSKPFAESGWDVIQWDIKINEFLDINLINSCSTALELFEYIDGIIAAPPCTDFTVSGNQYWSLKDANGTTEKSKELCRQVFRLADLFKPTDPDYFEENEDAVFFWAMENPVGRINTLFPYLDKPYYFNPCDFAGWLDLSQKDITRLNKIRLKNGKDVTWDETNFVVECNAYTKKTGLWGEFNRNLIRKPIDNVKTSVQGSFTQRYGGKSNKTKEARSNTPEGFAKAFFEANKNYQLSGDIIAV